jgi:HEPN domain-containing protein
MSDIEQAQSLLRLAYRDFNALLGMEHSVLCADEIYGFHAQQAIEKALKSWLCAKGMLYPLTHEIPRLLALLAGAGATVDDFVALDKYTVFAVEARYLEGDADEELLDRAETIIQVSALLERVSTIVADSK